MAVTPDKVQIGSSNDFLDGVAVDTAAGTGLFRETVVLADPENGSALANVRPLADALLGTDMGIVTHSVIQGFSTAHGGEFHDVKVTPSGALVADVTGSEVALDQPTIDALTQGSAADSNVVGAWAYLAGTEGTATVPAAKKVLQISASASTALAASFSVNGGPSIPIPLGQAVTLEPRGNLIAPSIVFTNTASYVVEYVG